MSNPEKPWYLKTICAFLASDVPAVVNLPTAAVARDVDTLVHRVTMEGESFLTKTLPQFGKSFDYALQERAPLAVSGFKKRSRRSALPAFLQALLERVFEDDGHIKQHPCLQSITVVRQLCYWCKKVEKGFSDESLQKAIVDLIEVDNALPEVSLSTDLRLLGLARRTIHRILGDCPGLDKMLPAHGPGAVAWSDDTRTKVRLSISYTRLERVFRPIPWFRSLRDASENPMCVYRRPQCEYGLSRLAFVEKDSSGPRLIGLEPAEYMWCQQALKKWLYDHIENRSLAKGRINFTDQNVNRELTLHWRTHDTLDMSSASDRNSYSLVKFLFKGTRIWAYLEASRTPGVVLPDGTTHFFKKFAPMGSAVCFPVEAMVFYAMAVSSLVKAGYPLLLALKNTFVYGDDLVVPHGYFSTLEKDFAKVGLKFSESKCCVSGKFRESCGLDSYDGVDVTPVRLRRPHLNRRALDLASLVEHTNALITKGYWAAGNEFRKGLRRVDKFFRSKDIPYTTRTDLPILSWLDFEQKDTVKYLYRNSQVFVEGYTFIPTKKKALPADNKFYSRISLSTGGPVGEISRRKPRVRVLPLRFRGSYRKRRLCIGDGREHEP